ncbi:MAG: hypothetical protein IRZ33_06405 [Alicyclobacillaceae bacterium]|nr:hypothetical protein [Alicyclobacillaceae bacterium]
MKSWKVWVAVWLVVASVVVCALLLGLWNNLNSEWVAEAQAAQLTLNHSPIDHIERHQVFTAAGVQEVFYGTDAFGRSWYAFVHGDPAVVSYIPADRLKTAAQVEAAAKKLGIRPQSAAIGYLDGNAQSAFHTRANVVWEVAGQAANGQHVYAYFDAVTGVRIGDVLAVAAAHGNM